MENTSKESSVQGSVTSPAQLDQMIGTSSGAVWGFLVCVTLLLLGICIWGVAGRLETRVQAAALCEDGVLTCFVKEENAEAIRPGMTVRVDGHSYEVGSVAEAPTPLPEDAVALAPGRLAAGDWVTMVSVTCDLPNGAYTAVIVTESVAPIFFMAN